MKKNIFIFTLILSFVGCVKPYHYNGTELSAVENLSSISFNDNELQIVAIDDVIFDGNKDFNPLLESKGKPFYIKSGIHKISSIIDWKDTHFVGNFSYKTSYKNLNIIDTCLNLEPKKEYYLYARNIEGKWKILVSDSTDFSLIESPDVETISCDSLN